MEYIKIEENGIHMVLGITEKRQLKLLHFSKNTFCETDLCKVGPECKAEDRVRKEQFIDEAFQLVQVSLSGYNRPYEKHGNKHIVTAPGYLLTYVGMEDSVNKIGRKIVITQEDKQETFVRVETVMQFYQGTSVVRIYNKVTNMGNETQCLEYLSSFCYTGIEKEGDKNSDAKMKLRVPYNGWQKEMSIKEYTFGDVGLAQTQPGVYQRTSQVFEVTNIGNWSSKKYLPLGYIENTQAHTSLFWQIEHNGSWHYEIGDQNTHFYVCVSGPTEVQSHWFKNLAPGESFTSVPVAVGVAEDSFEKAVGELTRYRRLIRRPNRDNEKLPVIFNDYMNCLFGDPTTEKELPLIDAAARCGCEYYVIDAGWYAPGEWWDSVGEWQECRERFPNGIREVTDYIRSRGMVPGVWLELEVMGINCEKAKKAPDDWFFVRHGKRVFDRSRYQLDFRNPAVIAHVDEVVDRVVNEYGVGYIKMDYNIEPGIGTEIGAESVGQGLLAHERAYLAWLDDVFARYPDLVIENCSSGGLRIDYALLSRYSIQSTSDQEDYRNYATIVANAGAGVTPEQAAVWSYPMRQGDKEETIYNMVNAMLGRVHQSGHLAELSAERTELVKEGIACYKRIRVDIKKAVPFYPLDVADNEDLWVCSGLQTKDRAYLAVWKRQMEGKNNDRRKRAGTECSDTTLSIPLSGLPFADDDGKVSCLYPKEEPVDFTLEDNVLTVTFEKPVMARLFVVEGKNRERLDAVDRKHLEAAGFLTGKDSILKNGMQALGSGVIHAGRSVMARLLEQTQAYTGNEAGTKAILHNENVGTVETYYLIDYENVHSDGLAGCAGLGKTDHIVIFFTKNAKNIDMTEISDHGDAELKIIEVPSGKQSADMHIGSYLGYLAGKYGKKCNVVIVSKDMDFDNVVTFWKEKAGIKASRAQQIQKVTIQKEALNSKQLEAAQRTEVNNEVMKRLSEAGYTNDIASYTASTAAKNFGVKNGKQQVYRSIIAKYGQQKGLPIYNQIKELIQ